jgi:hypothetical protein
VTSPVISLKTAAPVDGKDRPDHEIARAYEVAGDGEGDGDDDEGLDVTALLSGCWRATTGAGSVSSVLHEVEADLSVNSSRLSLRHPFSANPSRTRFGIEEISIKPAIAS